jgi:hypothetical protein
MAIQIVMDQNGDSRHNFDAKDARALLKAERRFKALTGAGFTAATRTADGEPVVTRTFDPTAEDTVFSAASRRLELGSCGEAAAHRQRSDRAALRGLSALGAEIS